MDGKTKIEDGRLVPIVGEGGRSSQGGIASFRVLARCCCKSSSLVSGLCLAVLRTSQQSGREHLSLLKVCAAARYHLQHGRKFKGRCGIIVKCKRSLFLCPWFDTQEEQRKA